MTTLKDKVLNLLEFSPETRNSDIDLTTKIWRKFHLDKLIFADGKYCLPLLNLKEVPSQDDIKRLRAHIQNKEHKFLPTNEEVLKQRGILEQEWYKESLNNFNNT